MTRKEQKQIPNDREIFTEDHLKTMIELNPPGIMPQGNVGTPTRCLESINFKQKKYAKNSTVKPALNHTCNERHPAFYGI